MCLFYSFSPPWSMPFAKLINAFPFPLPDWAFYCVRFLALSKFAVFSCFLASFVVSWARVKIHIILYRLPSVPGFLCGKWSCAFSGDCVSALWLPPFFRLLARIMRQPHLFCKMMFLGMPPGFMRHFIAFFGGFSHDHH